MNTFSGFRVPYQVADEYKAASAYFCMEFGIDQAFKIYSGGLGFLAGSHMRSAYSLKQNLVGIGILWKYGYYDQNRDRNGLMEPRFVDKRYDFLTDTGITFEIEVHNSPVKVKAYYLAPDVFGTAPLFFLSTDLPENDYLSRTICHHLYDAVAETKIAQGILLGIGGAKLLDILQYEPDVYHLNEAHALPAAFYLYNKLGSAARVKEKLVFTTHTPDPAGNEKHNVHLLNKMGFFDGIDLDVVRQLTHLEGDIFNHTLAGLRLAKKSNGVSKLHGEVSRNMWGSYDQICEITHITNSQNAKYWADEALYDSLKKKKSKKFRERKHQMKHDLFAVVADQCGKIFDPEVLTVVWARRFAPYKRADLLLREFNRFHALMTDTDRPIQIIWAGKPYPKDGNAINIFNNLIRVSHQYSNCAVLTGYELGLSKLLKQGSDIWLNTPRITREASGTSGMTAAMNGSVNFSTDDGWIPEFAKHGKNAFVIPPADHMQPHEIQDKQDFDHLYDILTQEIMPTYYNDHEQWVEIAQQAMKDILPFFGSDRMASEYYEKLYNSSESVSQTA